MTVTSSCDMTFHGAMLRGLMRVSNAAPIHTHVFWQTFQLWEMDSGEVHRIPQGEGGEQGDPMMPLFHCPLGREPTRSLRHLGENCTDGQSTSQVWRGSELPTVERGTKITWPDIWKQLRTSNASCWSAYPGSKMCTMHGCCCTTHQHGRTTSSIQCPRTPRQNSRPCMVKVCGPIGLIAWE